MTSFSVIPFGLSAFSGSSVAVVRKNDKKIAADDLKLYSYFCSFMPAPLYLIT